MVEYLPRVAMCSRASKALMAACTRPVPQPSIVNGEGLMKSSTAQRSYKELMVTRRREVIVLSGKVALLQVNVPTSHTHGGNTN